MTVEQTRSSLARLTRNRGLYDCIIAFEIRFFEYLEMR